MQEQQRMVRAISEDTERPYFRIRYRLSLSGKELLADALSGGNAHHSMYSDSMMDLDGEAGMFSDQPLRQRHSKSVIVGGTSRQNNTGGMSIPFQSMPQVSEMPGTPRSQYKMPETATFSWDTKTFDNDSEQNLEESDASQRRTSNGIKRTNSTGMLEMEVNRYGSPCVPLHQLQHEAKEDNLRSKGLVTCLNSKNVKKYSVGQRYRRGIIFGIDEEQGKIIVLHKDMPAGALCIMRTGNSNRYEKGYPVEDARGNRLGTVHAIDRHQDLIVLNTSNVEQRSHNGNDNGNRCRNIPNKQNSYYQDGGKTGIYA